MHPRNNIENLDSKFVIILFGTMTFFCLISPMITFLYIVENNLSSLLMLMAWGGLNILSINAWIEWFISNKCKDKLFRMCLIFGLVPCNFIYSIYFSINTIFPDLDPEVLLNIQLVIVLAAIISFCFYITTSAVLENIENKK